MNAPAGWYPDPNDPSQLLWWDGTKWTGQHTAVRETGTTVPVEGRGGGPLPATGESWAPPLPPPAGPPAPAQDPDRNADGVGAAFKQGALALARRLSSRRTRKDLTRLVAALAGYAVASFVLQSLFDNLDTFLALLGFGLVLGASVWQAHQDMGEVPAARRRWVYAGAVVAAGPLTVLAAIAVMVIYLAAALAVAALVLGGIVYALTHKERPQTVKRGANSHFREDGSPKVEYGTLHEAEMAAALFETDRGEKMSAYRCAEGKHFHIGHTQRRR